MRLSRRLHHALNAGCALALVAGSFAPALPPGLPGLEAPAAQAGHQAPGPAPSVGQAVTAVGGLPLAFVENQGQVDERARFYLRAGGQTLWFTEAGIVFDLLRWKEASEPGGYRSVSAKASSVSGHSELVEPRATALERLVFTQHLVGANERVTIEAGNPQAGVYNFFLGNDPAQWRTDVRAYDSVTYRDVWPGIDLKLYGNGRDLEQEFIVRPDADASLVHLAYRGIETLATAEDGSLLVRTAFGELPESAPRVYQEVDGRRVEVAGRFHLDGNAAYGFAVEPYDQRYALVIDPTLVFSSYLGGGGLEWGAGVAVDATGHVYVTGGTNSIDFPTMTGPLGVSGNGAYVTKLSPGGGSLVYSTFLGGSNVLLDEFAHGIKVDSAGNAYVVGQTTAANFPTVTPFQAVHGGGGTDAFVAKLNAGGNALVYSSYLGGSGADAGTDIAYHAPSNRAYVTGQTASLNFPVFNPTQAASGGGNDAFVAVVNPVGTGLAFSTYLGGAGNESGGGVTSFPSLRLGIAVDGAGNAYATGGTDSANFPTVNPLQLARNGATDAFVTKINPNSASPAIVYSTYFGGNVEDVALGIAVDSANNAYIAGWTTSTGLATPGAAQPAPGGAVDAFAAKINAAGSAVVYATYIGGPGTDGSTAIAVDVLGNAHVAGTHVSGAGFPAVNALQAAGAGPDAFLAKVNAGGSAFVYASPLGGAGADKAADIALDSTGASYLTGITSGGFPTTLGAYDTTFNGPSDDAWVAKIAQTALVSRNTAGEVGNGSSGGIATALSADGRWVFFDSQANNFHPDVDGQGPDLFAHDRLTGRTTQLTVFDDGTPIVPGEFTGFSVSTDGRHVSINNNWFGILVRDRDTDADGIFDEPGAFATPIAVANDAPGTPKTDVGKLSGNGRYIAFISSAAFLPEDTNGVKDVYVHDRDADNDGIFDEPGATARVLVSKSTGGALQSGGGVAASPDKLAISATGRFVAFVSFATNLVPGDTNCAWDAFLRDRDTDGDGIFDEPGAVSTIRVNVANDGSQAAPACFDEPSISMSDDGRYVAFSGPPSLAGLPPGGTAVLAYVRDTVAGTTTVVSRTVDGSATGLNGTPFVIGSSPVISGDGRFVAHQRFAEAPKIYDRLTGQTTELAANSAGQPLNQALGGVGSFSFTADGRFVAFLAVQALASNDTNNTNDVWVRDRATPAASPSRPAPPAADTQPPIPPVFTDVLGINVAQQTWNGIAEAGSLVKLKVDCNATPRVVASATANSTTGAFSIVSSPPFPPGDGSYPSACLTATDAAGNESAQTPIIIQVDLEGKTSGGGTVTTDTTRPSITLSLWPGTALVPQQTSPTSSQPIHLLVAGSETLYGLIAADVTVSSGVACGPQSHELTPVDDALAPKLDSPPPPSGKYHLRMWGMTSSCSVSAQIPDGKATDKANNTNTASNTLSVTYNAPAVPDTTPPITTITGTPANPSSSNVTFAFQANEQVQRFDCRLEQGTTILFDWEPCGQGLGISGTKEYLNLSSGTTAGSGQAYTFRVRGIDVAGNMEATASSTWEVRSDTDGDGLLDSWEIAGYVDVPANGTTVRVHLPDADLNRKDIYLHVDWMADNCHAHKPSYDALKLVWQAFFGHNIYLHVDLGPDSPRKYENYTIGMSYASFPAADKWGTSSKAGATAHVKILGSITEGRYNWKRPVGDSTTVKFFDEIKGERFSPAAREAFYAFVVWADQWDSSGSSGLARGDTADFIVSLGAFPPSTTCQKVAHGSGTRDDQAGTFMHELGHTLGLAHGGNVPTNRKPNYVSVMNYAYQNTGLIKYDPVTNTVSAVFDYSDVARAGFTPLDEEPPGISEAAGFIGPPTGPAGQYGIRWVCPNGTSRSVAPASSPIDWNCDNDTVDTGLTNPAININGDAKVNTDVICIAPGADGILQSVPNALAPGQDDYGYRDRIREGDNRSCNSTPVLGDDMEVMSADHTPPLQGFDDWGNLNIKRGRIGQPGFWAGAPPQTVAEDRNMRLETEQNIRQVQIQVSPTALQRTSGATVSVAILQTANPFDPAAVDGSSLRLGPAGGSPTNVAGLTQDVNGDNLLDRVWVFNVAQTGVGGGTTELCLTGYTTNPTAIRGCAAVTVVNSPPTAVNDAHSVAEGDVLIAPAASGVLANDSDLEGDPLSAVLVSGPTQGTLVLGADGAFTFTPLDSGTVTFTYQATDYGSSSNLATVTITITNLPPVVGAITAPVDPVAVGSTISASAAFTDPGVADTHSAVWNWDDGTTSTVTAAAVAGSGSVGGSHTYTAPGIYRLTLTVTDDDGGADSEEFLYVVVYDPSGGFVTGGGWINPRPDACTLTAACVGATGKATFGFVSKYQPGATVPTGETEFQFKAGNLNFHSTSYEWLVVAGARAQFKGVGTINGAGSYGFMLTAIDGQIPGGGGTDKFRIKIWDAGGVVYDNQRGSEDDGDLTSVGTALQGGSIVIHKG